MFNGKIERNYEGILYLCTRIWMILMEHSDYSTDDIASKCGFRNTAAFNSAFKFTFGITPTDYLSNMSRMSKKKRIMMKTRFKKGTKVFDIVITAVAGMFSVGMTVLLRDILFAPPLAYYALHLVCLTLSVLLLCTLTYFYARKNWKSYTKRNLWLICVIDMIIAALYNLGIYLEPVNEYTNYMLTEIWIRPTITYGLVACFVTESNRYNQ